MAQFPPPQSPPPLTTTIPPAARRTSGVAIASFILGLLGCIPWITGALAVVLGIAGLRKTRNAQVGGKGFAVAGLILGLLSFIGWSLWGTAMFGIVATLIHASAPQRALARQMLGDLGDQDLPAAHSIAASDLSPADLQSLADKVKPWGTLQDATTLSVNISDDNGVKKTTLTGVAQFAKGSHAYSISLTQENNEWKIGKVDFP
jgi:hypothetical protein